MVWLEQKLSRPFASALLSHGRRAGLPVVKGSANQDFLGGRIEVLESYPRNLRIGVMLVHLCGRFLGGLRERFYAPRLGYGGGRFGLAGSVLFYRHRFFHAGNSGGVLRSKTMFE